VDAESVDAEGVSMFEIAITSDADPVTEEV
jgi:hypothetical protein